MIDEHWFELAWTMGYTQLHTPSTTRQSLFYHFFVEMVKNNIHGTMVIYNSSGLCYKIVQRALYHLDISQDNP